jgi:hypothetical protein
MADMPLTLTTDECRWLATFLESSLKDVLVEEHRTRTPSYREHIVHNEEMIRSLLNKLRQPTA